MRQELELKENLLKYSGILISVRKIDKRNADIGEYESLPKEIEYDPIYKIISYECVSKIYNDTIRMRLKNHIKKKEYF